MKPIRVMIVEDERIIALDLKLQLEALGYEVCQLVATGPLAVAYAQALQPELILMDIHLEGGMDGIEAARQIHDAWKTPIVFLSAYAEDATLRRAETALPYGYLVKPVATRELNATLQMAMVRSQEQRRADEEADRFRQALESAELNVWEWHQQSDTLNIYHLVEPNYLSLLSPFCESIEAFYHRVDPQDLQRVQQAIEQLRSDGNGVNVAFRTRAAMGASRWIEVHAKCCRDTPMADKIIGVLQDVTERRRNEDRLRQAAVVFDSTSDGIMILNQQRQCLSVNPAFMELTGYSGSEIREWQGIDPLYALPHSTQFFNQLQAEPKGHWQGRVRYRKKSGETLDAWEVINRVDNVEGQPGYYVLVFSDISAVVAVQEQLDYLAKHDSLTNLCNRRLFLERLENEIIKCRRSAHYLGVLLIDLDHFKSVNDSLGHAMGDVLLKEAGNRLLGCVRATDTVARLGGDEFAIIVSDLESISDVDQIVRTILGKLTGPFLLGTETGYVTGSIGISIAPNDATDISELMKNADQAMYAAKNGGRNNFCFFAPYMQKASEMRRQIASSLHEALTGQQFWVAFQPIVDLTSGSIFKAEALLRWNHPVLGAVSPAAFIPIAEETGLIHPLSDWVFDQVTRHLLDWRARLCPQLQISINVSPLHFQNSHYQTLWLDHLHRMGLAG